MIFQAGKTYNFFYEWPDGGTHKRGEVIASEGPIVRIKRPDGAEEIINTCHILLKSVEEWDENRIVDAVINMPEGFELGR